MVLGTQGPGNGQFEAPSDVAIDSSGNIWVADKGNARIQKFDQNGKYLTQFGDYGTGPGEFKWPYGIAVDSLGDVWVSDGGNNRIQEFDTHGNYLSEFAVGGPACIAIDSTNMWVVSGPDVLEYSIVVPEPSALALLTAGAIGLSAYTLRRRRRGGSFVLKVPRPTLYP